MSIFPKRTLPGSVVTIHWNFNTSHVTEAHVFPFVRIGVRSPDGTITMLFEQYVLGLPVIQPPANPASRQLLYLKKNTPLLVLADYLSSHHKREELVRILQNIQAGRHYYFTYAVPANAAPGKYSLLSEVYSNGIIRYSATASDDFFLVETVTVENGTIINHSPEPVPIKVVTYQPGEKLLPENITVWEMRAQEKIPVGSFPENSLLLYNEERVCLWLRDQPAIRCIRNQQVLCVPAGDTLHVLLPSGDAYTLGMEEKAIWEKADGITLKEDICYPGNEIRYREMVDNHLLIELRHTHDHFSLP